MSDVSFYPEAAVLKLDPEDTAARARLDLLGEQAARLPDDERECILDLIRALIEQGTVWAEGFTVDRPTTPGMISAAVRVTAALAGLELVPPHT